MLIIIVVVYIVQSQGFFLMNHKSYKCSYNGLIVILIILICTGLENL